MSARGADPSERVLSLGIPALDAALPVQGLPQGSVSELQVRGTSGVATSFALCACRAAQQQAAAERTPRAPSSAGPHPRSFGGATGPWCAFIDPAGTLYAPGVARLGVDLDHLLVVRPELEAVGRAALRIVEANLASVLVIDLTGAERPLDEHIWQRNVRRLALAVKATATSILLLTRSEQFQTLPLPTFMRLEFTRRSSESFELRVAKERTGRISPAHSLPCSIFDPAAVFAPAARRVEPLLAESRAVVSLCRADAAPVRRVS
jgi:recombination protein RecA